MAATGAKMCPRELNPLLFAPVLIAMVPAMLLSPAAAVRNLTALLDTNQTERAREVSLVNSSVAFCGSEFDNLDPINSYAGHFTVDRNYGNHLFFWFFPAEDVWHPVQPLLVWLEGGPGMSSTISTLDSNGPVEINKETEEDDCLLKPRHRSSWVGTFSILYIDSPVGAGYSFSDSGEDGFAVNCKNYTDGLYSVLQQFFKLFPAYKNHPLYIGGTSYAGKYVPHLAYRVHSHRNSNSMNLTGLMLGSPFLAPALMSRYGAKFAYALGFIGKRETNTFIKNSIEYFKNLNSSQEVEIRALFDALALFIDGWRIVHDFVTRFDANESFNWIATVMETPSIQSALGISHGLNFTWINKKVRVKLLNDFPVSVAGELGQLMDHYKVLIYNGYHDFIVNSLMIDETLQRTPWTRQMDFLEANRHPWYGSEDDSDLRGFVTHVGKLCRVVVHGAGHFATVARPEVVLSMVHDFLQHGCVRVQEH